MGNSADRAWQLSQLVEGALTAFNPCHGSLSCVETNCGVVRVAGYSVVWDCISTSKFLQRAPKGALRPFSDAALLHYVSWCASEYSVVERISRRRSRITPEQMFNDLLRKSFRFPAVVSSFPYRQICIRPPEQSIRARRPALQYADRSVRLRALSVQTHGPEASGASPRQTSCRLERTAGCILCPGSARKNSECRRVSA